jgi:protein-tyrosine phosphatase
MRTILFICSGNYYRSRFAEGLFNHHAWGRGLPFRAISRGLATHLVHGLGDLSIYTRFALTVRGIELRHTAPTPRQLSVEDLKLAERSIALKETEHRPLMRELFPEWENKIEYWTVHDLDFATPEEALPLVEKRVLEILDSLDEAGMTQEKPQQLP